MSDSDIVKDFLVESYENLDRLDQELVGLEKNPQDRDALAGIFRTIHTIKGTCGFLGFNKLEKVTHVGENLLSRLRDGQLALNPEITTALLGMVDAVRQMLEEIQSTGQDGEADYPELRETLTRLQEPAIAGGLSVPSAVAPAQVADIVVKRSKKTAASSTLKQTFISPPTAAPVKFEAAEPHAPAGNNAGDESQSKPAIGRIGELLVERGQVKPEHIGLALQEQRKGDNRRLGEILVALGLARLEDVVAAQQTLESRAHDAASETIRVGVKLLDKLMTLVGELVLARNQLLQLANTSEDIGLHVVSQRMNLIATELQEEVMKTRMQPIGNVWQQFPRMVRDVALACSKEVEIEMEGKDTELDKTIIEAIKDPLTHLVRNAVDHGIELPEERHKAGKDRIGRLVLRAFHEGGQVNIEISDDGVGLNKERIRQKAVESGVITAERAARMPEREILNLIFLPGFSTAEKVTNISGRGVGMDVVKTNVEKIGGAVDVQSTSGRGTTVRVKIPLTLAIIPALMVTCGGDRYAIPQVNLLELVRLESRAVDSDEIESDDVGQGIELVHGAPVYRLRGRLLPLVYLDRELQLTGKVSSARQPGGVVNIAVLQADERQFGLVVDQVNDTEEIVVKPLRKQLTTVKMFVGSSIMGDGKVTLILDVLGLAQRVGVVNEARDRTVTEKSTEAAVAMGEEKQTFLLFAGQDDSRMAIQLSTLARLEQFPVSQVEISGNQWVTQYRGQILPLICLSVVLEDRPTELRALPAPTPDSGLIQVLVLNHEERIFGLVVERILDIVEDRAEIRSPATRAAVLYSVVIGERVTELLDIPAILRTAGLHVLPRGDSASKLSEVAN